MSDKYFLGQADAVAQISTIQITTFDAATTYTITVGGVTVSAVGTTDVNTTAAALQTNLAGEVHPYFAAVMWTVLADTITATAAVPGVPFTTTSSVVGGAGTIGAVATATASAGPNHFDAPGNWSGGTLPLAGDDVIIEDNAVDILFGLDGITGTLNSLAKKKSHTGKLGLDRLVFQTSNLATDTTVSEYRETYLKISCTTITLGEHDRPGTPADSTRVKINNIEAGASVLTVVSTASAASEQTLPAVRYLAANVAAGVDILSAPGGFGIGMDYTNETATVGTIKARLDSASDKVYVGAGVTLTNFEQTGGSNIFNCATGATLVKAIGGSLRIVGDYTIATLTNDGAKIIDNHIQTSGAANTVVNNISGTLDGTESAAARTWTTLNQGIEATLVVDPSVVTITNRNLPATQYKLQTSAA